MGDTVIVGGEEFYVLENSDSTQPSLKLITKYNLNTAGTMQENATYSTTACAFSSNNYWLSVFTSDPFNLNNISGYVETDAIGKARSYAQSKGATIGRLMTYEEANELKILANSNTKVETMLRGKDSIEGFLNYWLGSAIGVNNGVWNVINNDNVVGNDVFGNILLYGVRPVLEIAKDKIEV